MGWCILVVILSCKVLHFPSNLEKLNKSCFIAATFHVDSGGNSFHSDEWFPWDSSIMMSVIEETTTIIPSTSLLRRHPTMKTLPSCGSFRKGQIIYCPPGWTFGWYKLNETYCCYPKDFIA